jgi:hypothetical protein
LIGSSVELLIRAALALRAWPPISVPLAGLLFVLLAVIIIDRYDARGAAVRLSRGDAAPQWVLLMFDAAAARPALGAARLGPISGTAVRRTGRGLHRGPLLGTTIGSVLEPRYVAVTKKLSPEIIATAKTFTIDPNRFRGQPFLLG